METQIAIFQVIILIFSAVIHEYMHGWMANSLGDPTAKNLGRLTLNPLVHLEWFGSFLLPLVLLISGSSFIFGWAKPVPFNPHNLKDQKYGELKVAIAGPFANFITALFFGFLLRFFYPVLFSINPIIISLLSIIVFINLLLAIFNLIPIPPLDGSKIIMPFLPQEWRIKFAEIEKYGIFIILIFISFGFSFIFPIVSFLFNLIVGV